VVSQGHFKHCLTSSATVYYPELCSPAYKDLGRPKTFTIGFIGTVRGIGAALGQAHEAVQGDISGVTASLGVAFNSTFIALVISILIMFLMYQLQLLQERLVLDSQQYCDVNLMYNLQVR